MKAVLSDKIVHGYWLVENLSTLKALTIFNLKSTQKHIYSRPRRLSSTWGLLDFPKKTDKVSTETHIFANEPAELNMEGIGFPEGNR